MQYHGTYAQNEKDTNAANPVQFLDVRSTPLSDSTLQPPVLNDALSYLDEIRDKYAEQPEIYEQFLELMKDYKRGSADTPDVFKRVLDLFSSTPELIKSFNQFLPPGFHFLYSKQIASSNVDKGGEGMIATITSIFCPDDSLQIPIRVVSSDVGKPKKRKRDAENN
jgi:histone deacetylase complex regulatory component SIN3